MKIIDLLLEDQFQTSRVEKRFSGSLKSQHYIKRHEISRGTQAAVKDDKTDPHMVTKYNHRTYHDDDKPSRRFENRKDDGFNQFINYLIDNKLMGVNPHFPRVYDVKTITDREGKRIHTYTVEKLIEFDAVSRPELESFLEHSLHPDSVWIDPDIVEERPWVLAASERIAKRLELCVRQMSTARETLKSETLIGAIKVLHKMDKEFPSQLDIHYGNLMWRRTQHGLTLVFNDPIF